METIRYGLIGEQDLKFGTGSFEIELADGKIVTLNQVDLGRILAEVVGLKGYTLAQLNALTPTAGRRARVTDSVRGLTTALGDQWLLENAARGIPVEWFGADADGADDSADIQAAIDASPAGAKLLLRSGATYRADSTLNVKGRQLIGTGVGATIDSRVGATTVAIALADESDTVTQYGQGRLANLQLLLTGANASAIGVRLRDITFSRLENVDIAGTNGSTQIGIYLDGVAASGSRSSFSHVIYGGSVQDVGTGVYIDGESNANTFLGLNINRVAVRGYNIVDGRGNTIVGGMVQDWPAANEAIRVQDAPLTVLGLYAETATAAPVFRITGSLTQPTHILGGWNNTTGGTFVIDGAGTPPVFSTMQNTQVDVDLRGADYLLSNNFFLRQFDTGGTRRQILGLNSSDVLQIAGAGITNIGLNDRDVTSVGGISATTTRTQGNLRGSATFATAGTVSVTFAVAETDSTYFIAISGSANETFWVTSKATTGFTLNSSNAASTATVNWILIR